MKFQSQAPDTPMSSASEATKQELNAGLQMSITPQTNAAQTRSKPQACKICGKMLSSASSYYVHMKLHSGTKPFACTVSMYKTANVQNKCLIKQVSLIPKSIHPAYLHRIMRNFMSKTNVLTLIYLLN